MALVRANYEFWAENPAELSFQVGDIIKVLNRDDEGWWEGEIQGQGRRGLFPSNYVEPYTAINNYRAGGAQQGQGQRWNNNQQQPQQQQQQKWGNNNNNNQPGWNQRNNNGGASVVSKYSNASNQPGWNQQRNNNNNNGGGSVVSRYSNASNASNKSNSQNNFNGQGWSNNNNQQQGYQNQRNGQNNTGSGSVVSNVSDRSKSSNASNNPPRQGEGQQGKNWNNNNNNNTNNWNTNNTNNNLNTMPPQRDGEMNGQMKKPANLDTYNNIVNVFNNTNEPPRQNNVVQETKPKTIEEPVKKAAPQSVPAARPKVSPTKYGPWASNMGDITGMTMIGLGFCAIMWSTVDMAYFGPFPLWCGSYAIVMGVLICIYENSVWGQSRGASRVPYKAMAYLAISIFLFFSLPTLLLGLCCVLVAGVNLIATVKGEVYDRPEKQSHDSSNVGYFSNLYQYLVSFREQNKIGVLIFIGTYFLANMILFFVILWQFIKIAALAEVQTPDKATSYWIPYAKGFGNLLNMNASFIVLPVCRTLLRMLYNRSTADQSFFARFLRGILYFIPIDKNIVFHKLIARVIWISAVGHTISHFLNFAFKPTITYGIFGLSPFLTGGTLCSVILLIYSSARDNVRRGQFEIFWYNHHTFVIFFLANIFHGKGSIGPNYYKWFAIPGTIYLMERLLRIYRANQKVVVTSVTVMDDVLSIEIAKEGVFETPYKEGQYLFLQAPAISQIQWHPFTISSAPQEQTVTVHIRVCGEGSWTRGLRDYLGSMGPKGRPYFHLDRQGPAGKLQGKILGPDGRPILHIDGPHSAPTQHLGEYSAAMIAGAGIGVTPVASTLKSVVFHKWKYFIGQCFPDHAYFFWVCGHKDVNAFRWLIRHIKDAQDEVTHMRATNPQNMASKTFEFHIYVSSVPKDQKPVEVVVDDEIGFWGVPREDAKVDKVRCNWDEADLYKTMLCPPAHTELGDVHVWNGRPQWDARFQAVARNHPFMDIGVMFCGNPAIGRDLRRMCHTYSKGRNQGIFILHKENF